jgi:hypothetical protein
MSICRRCNRVLKTEPYATMGIGKICAGKEARDSSGAGNDDGNSDIHEPYNGGDIFIERVARPTVNDTGSIEVNRNAATGVRTNVPHTIKKHSPTGFNFGYGGSGPADFALNTLIMFTDIETAGKMYQTFKFEYIAGCKEDRLVIPKQTIINFINANKDRQ